MRKIGLIGGLTYVSTLDYYRLMNEMVNERLGGSEAAELILYSVNFGEIRRCTESGDWNRIVSILSDAAHSLERAGAAFLLIGANTMHKVADEVQRSVNIPLVHIAGVVAKEIAGKGMKKVALLGTRYTMQLDFYKDKLQESGIACVVPDAAETGEVNRAIYEEMSRNIFTKETKQRFLEIIYRLQEEEGAEGVILGCTEIPVLIKQEDCRIPVFDTTRIHVQAAVDLALA